MLRMLEWYFQQRRFLVIAAICLISLGIPVRPEQQNAKHRTELINRDGCEHTNRNVLFVSLMNGEIRAVDLETGSTLWGIHTGSKLLSSSISSLEVIYNGIPTRLVPSLDGSLFRFHDDSFEPLPFTAETLLSSSFKLPGDSTMVGSKDLRTVGLSPSCGQVYYKCDKEGCESTEQHNLHEKDVLVVKHLTHTVRAASLRTGEEKWNFSVAYHMVSFSEADMPAYTSGADGNCQSSANCNSDALRLKFGVPEGLVVKLGQDNKVSWEHKFEVPVSKSWVLREGQLELLDLLDPKYLVIDGKISLDETKNESEPSPSLYVGVFERQVYLQPSERLQKNMSAFAGLYPRGTKIFAAIPRVRYAPYITSSPTRTPFLNYGKTDPSASPPTLPDTSTRKDEKAVSLFHPTLDYPYDQGFYLQTEISETADIPFVDVKDDMEEEGLFDEIEHIIHIVQINSLGHYWREVLMISIAVAVILNGILYCTRTYRRRLKNRLKCFGSEGDVSDVSEVSDICEDSKKKKKKQKKVVKAAEPPVQPYYHSRYQSDFTHIRCLGKGGFGVVFHAKNTLDERDYAIKRITLPNSGEAKEKVMREVKALAMLDHPNIVRYFQSWFETPPPGWQEDQDKIWESTERLMPTPMNTGCPLNIPPTETQGVKNKDKDAFIPKLRFDDSETSFGSFGFPVNNRADDSLDIVFASRSGETSVSAHQPFHKYALAPAELESSDHPDSATEWDHLDDSGYHKNNMVLVSTTDSLDEEDSEDSTNSMSAVNTPAVSQSDKKCGDSQSKLFLYIQMQLCKMETLRDYLNANTLFRDRSEVLLIFRQICDAVEYIHSQGLIHRDLKPTNIFFSAENTIKVGDFGLVTALSSFPDEDVEDTTPDKGAVEASLTNNVGTQIYMSPEQVARRQYNSKVDIYALGMVFFELKYPFSTVMERVFTLQGIKKQKYPERFVRELPKEYQFVKWMLTRNPRKRPTISDILQSDLMAGSEELVHADKRNRTRTVSRSSNEFDIHV